MKSKNKSILVAGHICLDIIPSLEKIKGGMDAVLAPGKLFDLPPAILATGGAVPNTGCALHRLGIQTTLVGKIGDDIYGKAIKDLITKIDPKLVDNLIIIEHGTTAHAVVINPADTDRIFLTCSGVNDSFTEADLSDNLIRENDILHFGYPPLLKTMYEQDGKHLENLLIRAKSAGMTVSLDMSKPDPDSDAGKIDWRRLLEKVLPHVDIFAPSLDEIVFMINRSNICTLDVRFFDNLSAELFNMGAKIIAIKLGSHGLYLRTTQDKCRLNNLGRGMADSLELWQNRQLLSPCFSVNVSGTTGAGDTTIAGFLAALARNLSPSQAMTYAVATGACCVEQQDAISGIPSWDNLTQKINSGWPRREATITPDGWLWDKRNSIWQGPMDFNNFEEQK